MTSERSDDEPAPGPAHPGAPGATDAGDPEVEGPAGPTDPIVAEAVAAVQAGLAAALDDLGGPEPTAGVVALRRRGRLVPVSSQGAAPTAFADWPLPLSDPGPLAAAVAGGRPVWTGGPDLRLPEPPDAGPDADTAAGPPAGTGAFLPVMVDGVARAVLGVTRPGGYDWTAEERSRLAARAADLGDPVRVLTVGDERAEVLARLDELAGEPSEQARLDRAARLLGSGLTGDIVLVALASADGEWLERFGVHHPDAAAEEELRHLVGDRIRVGENRSSQVVLDGHPVLVPAMTPEEYRSGAPPRFAAFFEHWPAHGTVAVPLRVPGAAGPVGAVTAIRLRAGDPYGSQDLAWLQTAAERLAALAPPATGHPAGDDAVDLRRLLPLSGRPAGWALAVVVPLVVSVFLALTDNAMVYRPGGLYVAGVAAVAVLAGRRPAALAAVLSAVGLWWSALPPFQTFTLDAEQVTAFSAFILSAVFVVAVVGRLEVVGRRVLAIEHRAAARNRQESSERLAAVERQALADSRFRTLVEATTSVTWRADGVGRLVEPQPAWEAFTGQAWEAQQDRGWAAMVHPDDEPRVRAVWEACLAEGGRTFQAPLQVWSVAHGDFRHVVARAAPVRDRRGEIVEWIGAISDVHEQVEAAQRADQAAALLDTLTRQAPVGFGFFDTGGRYRLVNDALAAIHGTPAADHLGRLPDEPGEPLAPLVHQVLGSGEPVLGSVVRVGGADGGIRDLLISVYPVRGPQGELLGAGATVVDTTEENRIERELHETQARVAALMDADVLAFIFGEDEVITHANDAFLRLVGRTRDDLEAGRLLWTDLTPPEWAETDRAALDSLGRDGRVEPFEKEYQQPDGTRVPVEVGVVALDRRPLRWAAYVVDLRERKAVEHRLREAYDQRDQVARTLQTSLLPPELPRPDGLRFAARYLPSPVGEGVGGDFYDVFSTQPDCWHVVIGDVCGRGPDAAALTALTRYTLRAAAIGVGGPGETLRVLNDGVRSAVDDGRFCTVAYSVLRRLPPGHGLPDGGPAAWRATVSLGGHYPLRLLRGGRLSTVGEPGSLIGVLPRPRFRLVEVDLAPGDIVVAFTDGLIEQQRPPFAEPDLDALLSRLAAAGAGLDEVIAALEAEVAPEAVRDDDTALLAFQVV